MLCLLADFQRDISGRMYIPSHLKLDTSVQLFSTSLSSVKIGHVVENVQLTYIRHMTSLSKRTFIIGVDV